MLNLIYSNVELVNYKQFWMWHIENSLLHYTCIMHDVYVGIVTQLLT